MITRESDYAVRMIRALKDGEQLTIEQICRKEQVPRQFAYKILKKLEKAGAGGGCSLGRGLDVLTLLDVIRATDEEFFLNPCLKQGYRCEYAEGSGHNCLVHCELARVQAILERELRHKTLAELFC